MAYQIILNGPVETVVSGETYRVKLYFTINATGLNQSFEFGEKQITVVRHGNLVWTYDIEDALILPNRLAMEVSDGLGYLDSVLFGTGSEGLNSDVRFEVEVELNGTTEFKGNVLEDSIISKYGDKTLAFEAAPKTDELNKLIMFNEAGTAKFSHGTSSFDVSLELLNMFQKVNPSIGAIDIRHSWVFRDENLVEHALTDNIRMTDTIFNQNDYSLSNLGDMLKYLNFFFGSMSGMVHNEKAFFKELFRYDSANTQSFANVLDWHKRYNSVKIDWVKVVDPTTSAEGEEGSEDVSGIASQKIRRDINESMWESTDTDSIGEIKIPSIDTTFRTVRGAIAKFWYSKRNDPKNQRVDLFSINGVTANLLSDFTHADGGDTFQYQPVGMLKNFVAGKTFIDALYVGTA